MKNDPYPTKQTADNKAHRQSLPIWGDLEGYYHPDHLGSSSWITDQSGEAIQHLQYLPFGEQYVDQRRTGWDAMFTFSGKERDAETGYGYFGARYYDSDISIWLSVDPMAHMSPHQSPYVYCSNNPIGRVDPDGMLDGDFFDGNGVYLGSDKNKDDGKVHIVTNYKSQAKIKENRRKGETTNVEDVNVKVSTSYDILNEAVSVYDRTEKNGGNKEEYTVYDNDGTPYRGQSKKEGFDAILEIPISEGRVTIHSHPFTEGADGKHSPPTSISGLDKSTFSGFSLNIVVGKSSGVYDNTFNIRLRREPTMSFYNSSGESLLNMNISDVKNIKKTMRKRLIFLLLITLSLISSMAQKSGFDGIFPESRYPFDFIIFIDGKLPHYVLGEISFKKDSDLHVIPFESYYGRMNMLPQYLSIFDSIPNEIIVDIRIIFEEPTAPYTYDTLIYNFKDQISLIKRYRVIAITNFNKKKGIYYVQRITDGFVLYTPIWEKEYGNRRKFLKRIFEGLYPRNIIKIGDGDIEFIY